jgi:hypothetical protein
MRWEGFGQNEEELSLARRGADAEREGLKRKRTASPEVVLLRESVFQNGAMMVGEVGESV